MNPLFQRSLLLVFILAILSILETKANDNLVKQIFSPGMLQLDYVAAKKTWLKAAFKHAKSPMTAVYLRLIADIDRLDLPKDDKAGDVLGQLLKKEQIAGIVRILAYGLKGEELALKGDFAALKKMRQARGEINSWQVCGPFGFYGKAEFSESFAPEDGVVNLKQAFSSPRGTLFWQPLQADLFRGQLLPFAAVYPNRKVVVYLTTQIFVPKESRFMLHLETMASWKLWINNKKFSQINRLESYQEKSQYLPLTLPQGWNQILIKLFARNPGTGISVALTDSHGLPVKGLKVDSKNKVKKLAKGKFGKYLVKPEELQSGLHYLQQLSHRQTLTAGQLTAMSLFYYWQRLPDQALEKARQAGKLQPESTELLLLRAITEERASHLPREIRTSNSRRYFKQVLQLKPNCAFALVELAKLNENDKRLPEALKLLDQAMTINNKCIPALRTRLNILLKQKLWFVAEKNTELMDNISGQGLAAQLFWAQIYGKLRQPLVALKYYQQARQLAQSRQSLWLAELQALQRLGKEKAAEKIIRQLLSLDPYNMKLKAVAAEYQRILGKNKQALTEFEKILVLLPNHPLLWRRKGDILWEMKRPSQARAAYQQSLVLNPSQHNLRTLVNRLANKNINFWEPYKINSLSARQKDKNTRHAGATVRLVDQTVMQIYPDGSRAEVIHQLQKVILDGGITTASRVPIYGELLEARTLLPGRQYLEPIRIPGRNVFTMPGLRRGACVEYRFKLEHPQVPDYTFHAPSWYFRSPENHEDFVLTQYIVRSPKNLPLKYVQRNFSLPPRIDTNEQEIVYTWTMRNMERLWQEEGTPNIHEILPYVELGAGLNWQKVAKKLRNEYIGKIKPTFEQQQLLTKELQNLTRPEDKVKRLQKLILEKIDNTVIGNSASVILARGQGNRTTLLLSLLRLAGFDARYAALRPGKHLLYEPNWELPQIKFFTLRALAVFIPGRKQPLWLDLRYRNNTPFTLLEDFSGATAFVLKGNNYEFFTLPLKPPVNFATSERSRICINSDFKAVINGFYQVQGKEGARRKEEQSEASQKERMRIFEKRMAAYFPGFTALELQLPGLTQPGTPYRENYRAEAQRLLLPSGKNEFQLTLPFKKLHLLNSLPGNSHTRRNPYRSFLYRVKDEQIIIDLPRGFRASWLPEQKLFKNDFGSYQLIFEIHKHSLYIKRKYSFTPQFVPLSKWKSLMKMAKNINAAEQIRLKIIKKNK